MKKFLISFLAFLLNACVSTKSTEITKNGDLLGDTSDDEKLISAIELKSIKKLADLIPQMATYKVVLVGETHTNYGHHLNQLAVLKKLRAHWPQMAVGLEFVQQPFQKVLDQYIAGEIDETQMLRATEWYDRWRYDFRHYRPIFEYAKKYQIPLLALNVPKEITKEIMKVGISKLTAEQRAQLPKEIFMKNTKYRLWLEEIYSHHGGDIKSSGFEHFYEAQLAWDEGMANRSAQYIEQNPQAHLIVFVGQGHLKNRYGIPSRIERRINSKVAVVLNSTENMPTKDEGDYYLFAQEQELPKAGQLGIALKNTDSTLEIKKVTKESVAEKMNLEAGDLILSLDKNKVTSIAEFKILMLDKKPKDKISIKIKKSSGEISIIELELE